LFGFLLFVSALCCSRSDLGDEKSDWIETPKDQWPQIAMINSIEYVDAHHPVAGCSFLLDTGTDTIAATAKHILTYFKSKAMSSVSFENTLKIWRMYPKDSQDDVVVVDQLINEDRNEPIDDIPSKYDWLLFSIKKGSQNIQPLKFREKPLVPGEQVFIIGWRYTDKDCSQRIYQGNYVRSADGAVVISTKELADNTIPGLSGAPVVDSNGRLIGLMSRKNGKMEQLASIEYPREVLRRRGALSAIQDTIILNTAF
jgi:hypothetical protein